MEMVIVNRGMNSTRDSDSSRDSFRHRDSHEEERTDSPGSYSPSYVSKDLDNSSGVSRASAKQNDPDKYSSILSYSTGGPSNKNEDDFDDFDPLGTSSNNKSGTGEPAQVDLFGQNLIGDLLDEPTTSPVEPYLLRKKLHQKLICLVMRISYQHHLMRTAQQVPRYGRKRKMLASQAKNPRSSSNCRPLRLHRIRSKSRSRPSKDSADQYSHCRSICCSPITQFRYIRALWFIYFTPKQRLQEPCNIPSTMTRQTV